MSVTSGFFNSLNGDRRYSAEQMSAIFDGVINDGVFANIGTVFSVAAAGGNNITVGIGRAWFNGIWIYNDAVLPITAELSEVLLDRYDAVVIEVNHSESVRAATIKIVKGTPSSTPQKPTMANTAYVHQYPLAYIYRKAGSEEIVQVDITNMVGTSSCPYVTGILQVVNIDNVVAQWESQWNQWFTTKTESGTSQMEQWWADKQAEFNSWFDNVKNQLSEDAAGNLQLQINEIKADEVTEEEIDDILGYTETESE